MLFEPVPAMTLMRPRGPLDDGGDDALVLVVVERRRFAGGADRGEAIGPLLDVPVDELAEGVVIDLAVLERRDEGDGHARELFALGGHGSLSRSGGDQVGTRHIVSEKIFAKLVARNRAGIYDTCPVRSIVLASGPVNCGGVAAGALAQTCCHEGAPRPWLP